ncbi:MAG: citrate/2-methylcitrate synthase [Bdellovibrionota bacterium]
MADVYSGAINKGLEGVVACTTAISSIVDATLCYRGYTIEDLAEHATFEEVAFLLWNGKFPTKAELTAFKAEIEKEATLEPAFQSILKDTVKELPKGAHPMDMVRTAISMLSFYDPDVNNDSPEAVKRKALRLTAKMGAIIGLIEQVRNGREALAPKKGKCLGWNLLYLVTGKEPSDEWARIMDVALILHADHELNCSTFTTRVICSSLSDLHSAVVGAIGALKGPLHGGANTAVMEMLEEIATLENAQKFVDEALAQKKKVMGIGHRVYKNGDPRAKILRKFSKQLTQETGRPEYYNMSVHIDNMMQEKKGLTPNVDFYSATVYSSMGIPGDLFTPIFVASRVSGWCAHALEQWENNRIYRPRGEYTGPTGLVYKKPE